MIQKRSFKAFPSARVSWLAIALASSSCGVDVPLGELEQDPGSLVDEEPSGVSPVYEDAVAPERLGAPELTLGFASGDLSSTNNVSVGDIDGDGFDDMAVVGHDDATSTAFVHLRYGGPRPNGELGAFEFNQSGARLVVNEGATRTGVSNPLPAGDVDGDGYADLFVQTFTCENSELDGSDGYLLYGGAERWEGVRDLRAIASHLTPVADPTPAPDRCGFHSFAALGDIDGDGFDDLAMTHPDARGAYVIYGRARRFAAEASWSEAELHLAIPDLPLTRLELFPGGDLDGDGHSEILVQYIDAGPDGTRADIRVIVVRGTTTRSTGTLSLLELEPQLIVSEVMPIPGGGLFTPRGVGDLDGDGKGDFILEAPDGDNFLFYGAPELLAGPLELSQSAAVIADAHLVPVGDRDGDGDDELMALRAVVTEPSTWPVGEYGVVPAIVSGTRARLSGTVTVVPSPRLTDAMLYPDDSPRYALGVMAAGDLDNDGASDLFTFSHLGNEEVTVSPKYAVPQMHLHYGVHVPPASAEVPH